VDAKADRYKRDTGRHIKFHIEMSLMNVWRAA
jgi:hypothetical protein